MEREKQIKEMVKEMLEISTSANVEPVLEIDGKEIVLGESATRVLDNILEQAFIPYLAEKLYNAGYRKVDTGVTIHMNGESELTKAFNEAFALAPQLGWISVEDRLPQNDYLKSETERKKYLVYTEPRGIIYEATFGYEEHNWWVTKESIFDRVLSLDFGEDVTHYMPLPTPPKMKGAE